ncbi:MAG: hypothetical protein IBX64_09455 [Actinobacteria bacterium]|nr:hypothetical protein [Actinomycetota bacterium]
MAPLSKGNLEPGKIHFRIISPLPIILMVNILHYYLLGGIIGTWHLEELRAISDRKKASTVAKVLRNALAHGNIFTRGNSHINILVFLSRINHEHPEFGYNCITVSPLDFKRFMLKWFDILGMVEVPGWTFAETDLLEKLTV